MIGPWFGRRSLGTSLRSEQRGDVLMAESDDLAVRQIAPNLAAAHQLRSDLVAAKQQLEKLGQDGQQLPAEAEQALAAVTGRLGSLRL